MSEITDPVAAFDQLSKSFEGLGESIGTFFVSLVETGLERHEALEIVLEWQRGQAFIAAHGHPREEE